MARKHCTEGRMAPTQNHGACTAPQELDPRVRGLVTDLIGRVADKWTMLTLEVLVERGELRFTRLAEFVTGVSQKMLTQTLRHMERDGLVQRTVHPVVPPKVEYKLTPLGLSLGSTFCGVWVWAEENLDHVEAARRTFDAQSATQTAVQPRPRVGPRKKKP